MSRILPITDFCYWNRNKLLISKDGSMDIKKDQIISLDILYIYCVFHTLPHIYTENHATFQCRFAVVSGAPSIFNLIQEKDGLPTGYKLKA